MKKFKVYLDGELVVRDAVGWHISGSYLVVDHNDGSTTGHTGFIDFKVEVEEPK